MKLNLIVACAFALQTSTNAYILPMPKQVQLKLPYDKNVAPINVTPVKRQVAIPLDKLKDLLRKKKNQSEDDCEEDDYDYDYEDDYDYDYDYDHDYDDDCEGDHTPKELPNPPKNYDDDSFDYDDYNNRKKKNFDKPYDGDDCDEDDDWRLPSRIIIHEGDFQAGEECEYVDYIRNRCKDDDAMYWNKYMGLFSVESLEGKNASMFTQNNVMAASVDSGVVPFTINFKQLPTSLGLLRDVKQKFEIPTISQHLEGARYFVNAKISTLNGTAIEEWLRSGTF